MPLSACVRADGEHVGVLVEDPSGYARLTVLDLRDNTWGAGRALPVLADRTFNLAYAGGYWSISENVESGVVVHVINGLESVDITTTALDGWCSVFGLAMSEDGTGFALGRSRGGTCELARFTGAGVLSGQVALPQGFGERTRVLLVGNSLVLAGGHAGEVNVNVARLDLTGEPHWEMLTQFRRAGVGYGLAPTGSGSGLFMTSLQTETGAVECRFVLVPQSDPPRDCGAVTLDADIVVAGGPCTDVSEVGSEILLTGQGFLALVGGVT